MNKTIEQLADEEYAKTDYYKPLGQKMWRTAFALGSQSQTAEIERLREALEEILAETDSGFFVQQSITIKKIATRALKPKHSE